MDDSDIDGICASDLWHQYVVQGRSADSGCDFDNKQANSQCSTAGNGHEPLVFGIDETIERRWGEKISARGIPCQYNNDFLIPAVLATRFQS